MKVDNELQSLLIQNTQAQSQQVAPVLPQTQADFAEILAMNEPQAEETTSLLSSTDTSYREISASNLVTINAMLTEQLDDTQSVTDMQDFENEIYTIASMLDGLDAYAEKLAAQNSDKSAWNDLQSIAAQASTLQQQNLPDELNSILSEIELLATTEQMKMNRGDYLI